MLYPFVETLSRVNVVPPFNEHRGKPFPCLRCGEKAYLNKGSLQRHLIEECQIPPQYLCVLCGKMFHQKGNGTRHVNKVHSSLFIPGAPDLSMNYIVRLNAENSFLNLYKK